MTHDKDTIHAFFGHHKGKSWGQNRKCRCYTLKKILQLQNTNLGMSLIASWSKNWALA